jgi:hypothetical protein
MQICFVHLGNNPPEHLWLNLARIREMFSELKITLIGDSEVTRVEANCRDISYQDYVASQEELDFLQKISHQHDMEFRGGFWRYSLQRLFAAAQFAKAQREGTLHIESDILLMSDFPFSKFEEALDKVSWQKFNESHDVASLLWFPNKKSAGQFLEKILKIDLPQKNTTDMTVLSCLAQQNPSDYGVIPSAGDISQMNPGVKSDDNGVINLEIFNGYFDAAAFGMWVFGQDPKNYYGFALRYQRLPHSKVDASKTTFEFSTDSTCQDSFGNKVYSFHVHSKDKKLFAIDNNKRINFYFNSAVNLKRSHIFDFNALTLLIKDYQARKMLLHLVYNLPIIKNLFSRLPFRKKLRILMRLK